MRKLEERESVKPSMSYMQGGFEGGDIFSLKDGKYKGNKRSDFNRFYNDFWMTVQRHDILFISFIFTVIYSFIAAVRIKLGLSAGFSIIMSVLLFSTISIYGTCTLISSAIKFAEYKKEYKKLYQKWAKGEI